MRFTTAVQETRNPKRDLPIGIVLGLVTLLGQSRVFYAMSRDGLRPGLFFSFLGHVSLA